MGGIVYEDRLEDIEAVIFDDPLVGRLTDIKVWFPVYRNGPTEEMLRPAITLLFNGVVFFQDVAFLIVEFKARLSPGPPYVLFPDPEGVYIISPSIGSDTILHSPELTESKTTSAV